MLVAACLAAGMAQGEPAIKDRSVLGWWRYNGGAAVDRLADSSGYGNPMSELSSGASTAEMGGLTGGRLTLLKNTTTKAMIAAEGTPTYNGTQTYPYYTLAMRFKSGGEILSGLAALFAKKEQKAVLNDTTGWHFAAQRYQPDRITSSDNTYMVVLDPRYRDSDLHWINADGTDEEDKDKDSRRPLELASTDSGFLMTASAQDVTFGGELKGQAWWGDVDDAMVINRMLSKRELARLNFTGETFIYCYSGNPNFAAASGWSSWEGSYNPKPGDAPGAAYLVDNGLTMTQGGTTTFGVSTDNKVSLTLGRKTQLAFPCGTETVTKGVMGNFNHSSAGTLTFYDLRLVNGKFTGVAGGALNTTLLDIDTPSGSAFEINVASGTYAISSANAVTGEGTLKKTGAGTLDLMGLAGAVKVIVTEGKVLAGPNVTVTYDLEEDRGAVPVLMAE